MTVTMIRASHIIAYQDGGHRHLRDGVVVYDGDTIRHVGHSYDGPVDEVLAAMEAAPPPPPTAEVPAVG